MKSKKAAISIIKTSPLSLVIDPMKIVFCMYDFTPENLRLQPWLTIFEIGKALQRRGYQVEVITDARAPSDAGGIRINQVPSLRGTHSRQVLEALQKSAPDHVVTTVTPLNIVTNGWHGALKSAKWTAFASYPFYRTAEFARAFRHVELPIFSQYFKHHLAPRFAWTRRLRQCFDNVVCQSESTARRLADLVGPSVPVHAIPPGIDKSQWNEAAGAHQTGAATTFLYVGAATRIRGFHIALEAMRGMKDDSVRLVVLARGANTDKLRRIENEIARRGVSNTVSVEGGWLTQAGLAQRIRLASAVVLPFILVPSELPVSVMEAIACGTPVIATDIDGLPSSVGRAGAIVPVGSPQALAEIMLSMHRDSSLRVRCAAAAREQTAVMEDWDTVAERWLRVLNHD